MKIVCLGDVHLGAGSSLGREPSDRLRDQVDVLTSILDVAFTRGVEAILVAGDVFDGPIVTPEQMDVFARFIATANDYNIPVVAISGNGVHDASMRSVNGLAIFDRLPGITVYSRPGLHDLGDVQLALLPWVSPARLVASMDGDVDRDRVNARAAELLVQAAAGIADPTVKPTILMLHGSISGASLPAGIPTDELREPVLPLDDLLDQGWATIIASHIHVPQYVDALALNGWMQPVNDPLAILAVEDPLALYTGSPMPLSFGETTVPHGVWILDVTEKGALAEFVPIESRPLLRVDFDIANLPAENADVIYDEAAWPEVDAAIVKVTLRCTQAQQRRLDTNALRAAILFAGAHSVKIDVDTVREERSRVDSVTADLDPAAAFDLYVTENGIDPALATAALEQLQRDLETVGV